MLLSNYKHVLIALCKWVLLLAGERYQVELINRRQVCVCVGVY